MIYQALRAAAEWAYGVRAYVIGRNQLRPYNGNGGSTLTPLVPLSHRERGQRQRTHRLESRTDSE